MQLPNGASALVPTEKLLGYLLSETHPVGRFRSRVFTAAGFTEHNINDLLEGLLSIARTQEVKEEVLTIHGRKYVLDGEVPTPTGESLRLRTVWMTDVGSDVPRFITAYPL